MTHDSELNGSTLSCNLFDHNLFMNLILIYCCHSQIFELCYICEGFIRRLNIMILLFCPAF